MYKTVKIKLQTWISEETNTKLRSLIMQKYNKFERGLLSYEVEQALINWMAEHKVAQNTLTQIPPNPGPKVSILYGQCKEYIITKYNTGEIRPGNQMHRRLIEDSIRALRGEDKRTVSKWFNSFLKNGLIKHVVGNMYEMM